MPTFEISLPDGAAYEVEAADEQTAYKSAVEGHTGKLESFGRGAIQGATINLADEMAGGMAQKEDLYANMRDPEYLRSIIAAGQSDNPNAVANVNLGKFDESKQVRQKATDQYRAKDELARQANPKSFMAGEVGGGIATALVPASQGASLIGKAAGKGLGTRMGAGIAEGAAYGAGYGFGAGEGDAGERIGSSVDGAITGGVLGGALPVAGAALKRPAGYIASKFNKTGAQQKAGAKSIERALTGDGLTVDDAVSRVRGGEVLGQQGEGLSDLTRAVKRQPDIQARNTIVGALDEGYSANNQATSREAMEALGAEPNFYSWLDVTKKSMKTRAAPAYDAAFSRNWGKAGPPLALDDIIDRIPAQAMREAQAIARAQGLPFGENLVGAIDDASGLVTFTRLPSLQEAELIRRGLNTATSAAYRGGRGGVGSAWGGLEKNLRGILDDASPHLKSVRTKYADDMAIQEAAEEGLTLLNKPADFIEWRLSGMSNIEKTALRKGFASALKHKIESGHLNRDQVKRIFGSEQQQRALSNLFPSSKEFASFRKGMENRAGFSDLRANVTGNSRTQQDLADTQMLSGGGLLEAAARGASGDVRGALNDVAMNFLRRQANPAKGMPPEQLRVMAKLLVESNPDEFLRLFKSAESGNAGAIAQINKRIGQLLGSSQMKAGLTAGAVEAQRYEPLRVTIPIGKLQAGQR